jgi:RND family efflux transporter MFP subunit
MAQAIRQTLTDFPPRFPDDQAQMRSRLPLVTFSMILTAAAMLGGCGRGAPGDAPNATAAATSSALTVTTTTIAAQQLVRTVPATGSMYAWQEVIVGAEVGGYRVAEVLVDVGSHVKKGQALVRLSTDMLEADLNSKRAALRSAEAAQVNAAAALRRGESVSTAGALSAANLDQLKADQIAAQARVDTAKSDVTTAELRLHYGTVTAPDFGTITARTVSVGQIAQAGAEMLRMLRQDRVEWRAEIPESQLSLIKAGQSVDVTTVDGSLLKGRVRTVAPTIQTTTRVGLVYVDVTGGNARPGMFARGDIAVGTGPGLLVPVASVVTADGYSSVFVVHNDRTVARRRVTQAGVFGSNLEIADGLAAGEVIAVKGAGFLKDGDIVSVDNGSAAQPVISATPAGS